jgi:16S rRNA (adenine(1408)-N(1))-methyltransferase
METIRGKTPLELKLSDLQARLAGYRHTLLDLGTGDGRFVRWMAEHHPAWFVIGLDACRENLRINSQAKLSNALFVIASAQTLPHELRGLADHVTINFPWGSLLEGLLDNNPALMNGLLTVARPGVLVDIRLNGGALAEVGWRLEAGAQQIQQTLAVNGFLTEPPAEMTMTELRAFPSTWARRLAFGRDPRAMALSARCTAQVRQATPVEMWPVAAR